ncbi:lef-6 [Spodoptera litura granulovirus]|uniref:Lef-6 n=1 Tax=Spodoptera litura granulovirus TaxID=359919 RepID=A5IZS1_9BBAC|nr:lef-6 [Spodoptera litura granulovirus]ABQ52012.1 lef-6 [Spodoptera litura granulovirus]
MLTTKVYLLTKKAYPLWLTKELVLYCGGQQLHDRIDWKRSSRKCLYVKGGDLYVKKLCKLKFYFPNGELFCAKTEKDYMIILQAPEIDPANIIWFDDIF